jgi:Cu2+-exporting ATPase
MASDDSYLSKVIKLVDDAQKSKSKTQLLADRAALVLTIVALTLGFGTFAFWLVIGESLQFALERMVTVIIISCPHALGLAVPLVVAISTTLSAKNGLLIKNRTAFENSRKITTIIFDKTGTLTIGKFEVARIKSLQSGFDEKEIIRIASAIEQNHLLWLGAKESSIYLYVRINLTIIPPFMKVIRLSIGTLKIKLVIFLPIVLR